MFETLRDKITGGEYREGTMLPPERELCLTFDINRVTLRRALEMLSERGFVRKHAGVGTEVVSRYGNGAKGESRGYVGYILYSKSGEDRFSEPFQTGLFYQIERQCAKYGFHLIYKTVRDGNSLREIISGINIAYFVFSSQTPEPFLDEALKMGIPSCVVNNCDSRFTSIQSDNYDGAYRGVEYLWKKGHRKLAIVTGPENYLTTKQRLAGCFAALKDVGAREEDVIVYNGDWEYETGFETGRHIGAISCGRRPDAIFAFNDRCAMGVIDGLETCGISVPGQVSVMGYDNIPACEETVPAITTTEVDIRAFAVAIVQQIRFAFETGSDTLPLNIVVRSRLIERESVRDIGERKPQ